MKTGKTLWKYALIYKKLLISAVLLLMVAVGAELTGPFIGKKMIDDHILGIEKTWYEVSAGEKNAVSFQGKSYVREDRYDSPGAPDNEAHIYQVGTSYYFVGQAVSFDGDRKVSDGKLTISKGGESRAYPAEKLTKQEIFKFYQPEIHGLLFLIFLYLGLLVFSVFFQYGQHYLLQMSANRIIQKMRQDVFSHLQTLPVRYFDNLPAGKVVARVTNDTEAVRDLYVTVLSTFVTSAIYMIGIFTALFLLDIKLAFLCLAIVPIILIWSVIYRKYASDYNHQIRSINSDINAKMNESIQGMPIIQAFRHQKETMREFEQLNESHFHYQNKMLNLNSLLSHNLVNVIRNLAFVGLIWHFGSASLNAAGIISIGVLYAFVDYLNRLFQPITGIVNQFSKLELARVSAGRVFELLAENETEAQGVPAKDRASGQVEFRDVSFAYNEGEDVLKNISFKAKKGETIALVGHTGSGKSSILNILFRFYDAQKGDVLLDGKSIYEMSRHELRTHMGIVLQDPYLFSGTIGSNVSMEDERISAERITEALRQVGAENLLKNLPKGVEEPVIEKGSTLSSGERQLISFARALAFDPAILILDEATANIDTETEAVIQNALDVVKQGRTTFVIAHRLSTIRNADTILVMEKGSIIEKGSHEELMEQKGQYYQMYELQKGKQNSIA
ncbi:ABC transporter ATP-binding protein [Bacillus atrophaeus]|uniref:ABC transporter ATP-binding protein n=1 Tax=Bacillus atrophaeus TaxID=1452 RepID=UPI002282DEDA|nr:ABC transporter ATP-binding protein [Bacillus atrophaeus]MCY8838507.1 ABC transporter ATP-binding protein/permease [Bacillus atrophaeus]MEC5219112.1 ABC transporter ATP-binding protein [Bacillus atrophaeus]MED4580524.1 ABC transporter ATP-binding protein [Bacillus atrophaeus]MED4719908.1 ABC transporter ATP-binding protein [Bacillus atrophaeus]MED4847378.1 ABC transporter ATP-binding protein [Bacillus atrophaeus]